MSLKGYNRQATGVGHQFGPGHVGDSRGSPTRNTVLGLMLAPPTLFQQKPVGKEQTLGFKPSKPWLGKNITTIYPRIVIQSRSPWAILFWYPGVGHQFSPDLMYAGPTNQIRSQGHSFHGGVWNPRALAIEPSALVTLELPGASSSSPFTMGTTQYLPSGRRKRTSTWQKNQSSPEVPDAPITRMPIWMRKILGEIIVAILNPIVLMMVSTPGIANVNF